MEYAAVKDIYQEFLIKWEAACVILQNQDILYIQQYLAIIVHNFKRNNTGKKLSKILVYVLPKRAPF